MLSIGRTTFDFVTVESVVAVVCSLGDVLLLPVKNIATAIRAKPATIAKGIANDEFEFGCIELIKTLNTELLYHVDKIIK